MYNQVEFQITSIIRNVPIRVLLEYKSIALKRNINGLYL